MLGFLRRLLWPFRPTYSNDVEAFRSRMQAAHQFGVEQQEASIRSRQASRDFAETMRVPPVWRPVREGPK